jgi:hypothetical protein
VTDGTDLQQGVGLILLRQISGDLTALSKDMRDVRDRLVTIESQGAIERIERLSKQQDTLADRVNALESDRDKRTGMTDLTGWFIKNTPWIAAIVLGAIAFVLKGHV